jgi:hypothetical protein
VRDRSSRRISAKTCILIAAAKAGLETNEDITEEWREW